MPADTAAGRPEPRRAKPRTAQPRHGAAARRGPCSGRAKTLAARSVSRDPAHRGMRVLVVDVLVVKRLVIVFVVVAGVLVAEIRICVSVLSFRADTQLGPQPVKVSAAAVVLKLTGYLYLLGLGSAAPHWLDPLERTGPNGPLVHRRKLLLPCRRTWAWPHDRLRCRSSADG